MHGVPNRRPDIVIAYVLGYDAATEYRLLDGFAAWLNRRRGGDGRTNFTWDGELMAAIFGVDRARRVPYSTLSEEDPERLLETLYESLDAFLSEVEGVEG